MKGRPRKRFAIKVDTERGLVDFIGPFAELDGGLAVLIGKNARDRSATGEKMRKETMLFKEALAIANRAGMTLDEDAAMTRGNYAGR